MRKHDELTDPTSCLNRARDDEWTFVLLGRDAAAPAAVRAWIGERLRIGKNQQGDPQIVEAEQWAVAVEAESGQSVRRGAPRKQLSASVRRGLNEIQAFVEVNLYEGSDLWKNQTVQARTDIEAALSWISRLIGKGVDDA